MKIIIASGYYDPVTIGHIEYLKLSKKFIGEGKLIVIVNNDDQAILKKGKSFMKCDDRIIIMRELKDVDDVIKSIDIDKSVCKTVEFIYNKYKNIYDNLEIWFANGGDSFNNKIPEKIICDKYNIKLIDNLGEKIASSSWLTGLKPI
jgi:D-beta-D-heptose 7-phosphate kinase/D-beta-D-heptose 1-phosphate adenosyltransferase